MALRAVFIDIGGTLGDRDSDTGKFTVYQSRARLLRSFRDELGLRIGVITAFGALTNAQAQAISTGARDGRLNPGDRQTALVP